MKTHNVRPITDEIIAKSRARITSIWNGIDDKLSKEVAEINQELQNNHSHYEIISYRDDDTYNVYKTNNFPIVRIKAKPDFSRNSIVITQERYNNDTVEIPTTSELTLSAHTDSDLKTTLESSVGARSDDEFVLRALDELRDACGLERKYPAKSV